MKPLYDILTESIINESQQELYHYTTVKGGEKIAIEDQYLASEDDGNNPPGYDYYMSTTRLRNAFTGYPTGMLGAEDGMIRFVFDGGKLNSKFKIVPVDFNPAKWRAIKKNWGDPSDFETYKHDIMLQTNVEAEDRVLLKTDRIKDLHKYLREIHCHIQTRGMEHRAFLRYEEKYGVPIVWMTKDEFLRGMVKR